MTHCRPSRKCHPGSRAADRGAWSKEDGTGFFEWQWRGERLGRSPDDKVRRLHIVFRLRMENPPDADEEHELVGRRRRSTAAAIPVVQAAHHRLGEHPATGRWFYRTRLDGVVAQSQ